jgi:hypothetical protein
MARMKQAGRKHSTSKAAAAATLGAAGFGLSLAGSAFASTLPTADVPQSDNSLSLPGSGQRFVLGEEEMADVSLATFHLFDKENGTLGQQIAWVGRCGGCRGCGWRGCRCGGCRGCGGCCRRWGRCRWC